MANLIYVVGRSGFGKSTSLRNLDPKKTLIINTDQKPLPFKKFKEKYNEEIGNYLQNSEMGNVLVKLKEANKNPEINTVVVDTWTRIMTDFVMSKKFRQSSGFEKWGDLSGSQYDLLDIINKKMREDINVYLFCHPDTVYDEDGFPSEKISTQGKQLERFSPESFSSIVLYAEIKNDGENNEHLFRTKSSGSDTCKTPMGMFEKDLIPNDLVLVNKAINEYY